MKKAVVRIVVAVVVLAAIVVALRFLPAGEWFHRFQLYVHGLGAIGYLLYIAVYAVAGLFFPASVLTIGAGALFGVLWGSVVVTLGATIAATLAFILARTILRDRIEQIAARNPRFRAVDEAIAREGVKIVFLVRLSASFPFLFINYAFGLTGIRLMPYVAATFLGIIPLTVAFVYLGATGVALGTESTAKIAITVAGALIALGVSIFVARLAYRAIKRAGVDAAD